jgi:hypothetical protein
MPIHELEEHPYLNYYQEFGKVPTDYYKGIIIGSFPIYAITNTVDEELKVIKERFTNKASMRFFYGSKKSDLWKYVGLALTAADPRKVDGSFLAPGDAVGQCKKLLFEHRILISDSIFRTNRKEESADDTDLMLQTDLAYLKGGLSLNTGLIQLLNENKQIQNIYFTSTEIGNKGPFYWFKKIFDGYIAVSNFFYVADRAWSAEAIITLANGESRNFRLFFLPTPKARGLHWAKQKTLMFGNYMKHYGSAFFREIDVLSKDQHTSFQTRKLAELRVLMLTTCYQQAMVYGNLHFDGSNPILNILNDE